jgi:hypothetical protein
MNIKGHATHYILGLYFRFQPFSINASTHNSLHAGHWAHAMNTWSCMSHRSGIVYAHVHHTRLSLGVYLVPRSTLLRQRF